MKRILIIIAVVVFCSCAGGYSFTGASIAADTKTFSVEQFVNRARIVQPMLASDLTLALLNKINSGTSLTSVNGDADLNFRGEITSYSVSPAAIGGDDKAAKNRLTITVKVDFINKKDSKMNFQQSFTRFKDYDSQQSLTDVEESLIKGINEELVDDIFNKALINW